MKRSHGVGTGLTEAAGTHAISMSPASDYFVDSWSSLEASPQKVLRSMTGAQIAVVREQDLSGKNKGDEEKDKYDILPTEIVKVPAEDGTTLYARLTKPAKFDPA